MYGTVAHASPLGTLYSTWNPRGLHRLDWNRPDSVDRTASAADGRENQLNDFICEYFETGRADFGCVPIDPVGWTDFSQQVYQQCRKIDSGQTLTYKELAAEAGSPRASRAVGAAMARNRVLLVVPCHRVIASDGKLTGFSANGGIQTKQSLLDLERSGAWV